MIVLCIYKRYNCVFSVKVHHAGELKRQLNRFNYYFLKNESNKPIRDYICFLNHCVDLGYRVELVFA